MSEKNNLNEELEDMARDRLSREKIIYEMPQMDDEELYRMKEAIRKAKKENRGVITMKNFRRAGIAAAAALALMIVLPNTSPTVAYAMENIPVIGRLVSVVTFREYSYEDENNRAEVNVAEIGVDESYVADESVRQNAEQSVSEINAEIEEISERFIREFEDNLSGEGYQDITVKSEVVNTADDYFTLKLITYIGSGSGSEWNTYYTIDLATGNRLALKDLFKEGADYIAPISENIKDQMREQMENDENATYWLDSEVEAWNFDSITEDVQFYINEEGNLVISFDEGEVAPMYMGVVSFEIPDSVTENIIK